MIYAFGGHRKNKLIVTFGEQKAKELYDEYSFFDKEVVYYPSKDVLFYQSDIRGNLLTAERIRALKAIHEQESVTLVTTFDALMNTMAPIEKMWENVLTLEQGQLLDLKEIQAALIRMGYEKEYQVQTMLDQQKIQGFLPIWALWGKENFCMIGNHAIPVIVDAYLKGFKGFDAEEAYQAVKASATVSHFNSDWETFEKYGYFPFDIIDTESVSKTLECAYDDYCVAQMAKALGKTEDYERFSKRAAFYKNLFDPELKLMRGKDSKGNWRTPFNSFLLSHASSSGGDFTEGNSWQYTWHVQHDVQGLIDLMGGNEAFVTKLDSLFFLESTAENTGFVSDVTGLIGQYAHGNEPSHHVAYLYSYAGHPEKTQQVIREVFDRFYLAQPDGLCGNDDCGQMSAWYIFSAMGFYPVNPISGEYVLGAPQIEKISLSLPEGKTFTVEAKGLSKTNKYVKSVELNGKPVTGLTISHKDVMNGGNLVFTMTDQPGR